MRKIWFLLLAILMAAAAARAQTGPSVVNTVHNLSTGGPGKVKASGETEICIFCHAPHNATTVQPLWNRSLPVSAYRPYASNSLKAAPGQPTGASKLCLSCHDGTIALGNVHSRGQAIAMANGVTTLPPGSTNLGTDLSGDHPISFRYDSTLASKNPKLLNPGLLPPMVRLDANAELQCTTCHDAHNNTYGNFLVMSNVGSALCNKCHQMGSTDIAAHQTCASCHQPHTSPSGPYLLTKAKVSDTCLPCHNGAQGANQGPDIAQTLTLPSIHDTKSAVNLPDHIPDNVDCKDCHEPHTTRSSAAGTGPLVKPLLGQIDGINLGGGAVARARYEYEVCFKCHADKAALNPYISRRIVQTNLRLTVAPGAVSYHPIEVKGRNTNVPSLRPPLTINSVIGCTDCHGSDTSKRAGGTGANGPHGSNYRPLLLARYETADRTAYTTSAYALCFQCHDNTLVVADSGPFPRHKTHIQGAQAPCSICHAAHGISGTQGTVVKNFALINFDTSVVLPESTSKRLEYDHTGTNHGSCFLNCHGKNHNGLSY
jgi:predicted CXXCH cytochrome family protein